MDVGSIRTLGSIDPRRIYEGGAAPTAQTSFAAQLNHALGEVNQLQGQRDQIVTDMISGRASEVHDVMTTAQEAQLAFELLLEVRNKLLESYQELMRLQV